MIEYRSATIDDAPAMCELINRSERFDGVPRVLELDELVEELSGESVDLARSSLVAVSDGAILGLVYLYHQRATAVEQRCIIDGTVDPDMRGRGIGGELIRFAVARSTELLEAIDDDLPKFIRIHAYDYIRPLQDLALSVGFAPVRYFDELLRPLTDLPPRRTTDGTIDGTSDGRIDGLTLRVLPPERIEDARLSKNEAFLDHWGSTPTSAQTWDDQLRGFGSRPDLSFVAIDDATGQIVAVLISSRYPADDELLGRSDGWIQTLATLRPWRGRGVASALIVEALHAYAAAGLSHASIGVDSENPSGAARLYRGLGFEPVQRMITFQIEL